MKLENRDKIIQILNELSLLEFKTNYNLSEMARVIDVRNFNKDPQVLKLRKELFTLLPKETKELKYHLSNEGMLEILELNENGLVPNSYKIIERIFSTLNIPYGYVMGKKIGKKAAMATIEYLENSFTRYQF